MEVKTDSQSRSQSPPLVGRSPARAIQRGVVRLFLVVRAKARFGGDSKVRLGVIRAN
jgi:hypothetical protein